MMKSMAWFTSKKVPQGTEVAFELPVSFIEEGDATVAYSPALDLSTCGKNKQDAQRMFEEAVHLFFEDLVENGTIDEVLTGLNWKKNAESAWQPPKIEQESIGIRIPAFA
jgi:hypothetical protein